MYNRSGVNVDQINVSNEDDMTSGGSATTNETDVIGQDVGGNDESKKNEDVGNMYDLHVLCILYSFTMVI